MEHTIVVDLNPAVVRVWSLATGQILVEVPSFLGDRENRVLVGRDCYDDLIRRREGTVGRRAILPPTTGSYDALGLTRNDDERLILFLHHVKELIEKCVTGVMQALVIVRDNTPDVLDAVANGLQMPVFSISQSGLLMGALRDYDGVCCLENTHLTIQLIPPKRGGKWAKDFWTGLDTVDNSIVGSMHRANPFWGSFKNLNLFVAKAREALNEDKVHEVSMRSIVQDAPVDFIVSRERVEREWAGNMITRLNTFLRDRSNDKMRVVVTGCGRGSWWLTNCLERYVRVIKNADVDGLVLAYLKAQYASQYESAKSPWREPSMAVPRVLNASLEVAHNKEELDEFINRVEQRAILAEQKGCMPPNLRSRLDGLLSKKDIPPDELKQIHVEIEAILLEATKSEEATDSTHSDSGFSSDASAQHDQIAPMTCAAAATPDPRVEQLTAELEFVKQKYSAKLESASASLTESNRRCAALEERCASMARAHQDQLASNMVELAAAARGKAEAEALTAQMVDAKTREMEQRQQRFIEQLEAKELQLNSMTTQLNQAAAEAKTREASQEERIAVLKAEIVVHDHTCKDLSTRCSDAENETERMRLYAESCKQRQADPVAELARSVQARKVVASAGEGNEEVINLRAELKVTRQKLEDTTSQLRDVQGQIAKTADMAEQHHQAISGMERRHTEAMERLRQGHPLTAQLEKVQAHFAEVLNAKDQKMRSMEDAYTAQVEAHQHELNELHAKMEAAEARDAESTGIVLELRQSNANLEAETAALKNTLSAAPSTPVTDAAELEEVRRAGRQEMVELKHRHAEQIEEMTQRHAQEMNDLHRQTALNKSALDRAMDSMATMAETIRHHEAIIESQRVDLVDHARSTQELTAHLKAAQDQVVSADRNWMVQAEKNAQASAATVTSLAKERDNLQSLLTDLRAKNTQAEALLHQVRVDLAKAGEQSSRLEREKRELVTASQNASTKLAENTQTIASLKGQLEDAKRDRSGAFITLELRNKHLGEDLALKTTKCDQYMTQLTNARRECDEARLALGSKERAQRSTEVALKAANDTAGQLRRELAEERSTRLRDCDALRRNYNQAEAATREHQILLAKSERTITDLVNEVEHLKKQTELATLDQRQTETRHVLANDIMGADPGIVSVGHLRPMPSGYPPYVVPGRPLQITPVPSRGPYPPPPPAVYNGRAVEQDYNAGVNAYSSSHTTYYH